LFEPLLTTSTGGLFGAPAKDKPKSLFDKPTGEAGLFNKPAESKAAETSLFANPSANS